VIFTATVSIVSFSADEGGVVGRGCPAKANRMTRAASSAFATVNGRNEISSITATRLFIRKSRKGRFPNERKSRLKRIMRSR
jgi:hypothetical protein